MLRVGLTGDLGSGKSTVGKLLAARGAAVVSSDDMGRAIMEPGQPVFAAIAERFGTAVVAADGTLNRRELARLAFESGRVEELNAIVHPAVLQEQARLAAQLERQRPDAVFVVESALIFTTTHGVEGQPWRERFDRILMVVAPQDTKIRRFVERAATGRSLTSEEKLALEQDAQRRLEAQAASAAFEQDCIVIRNDGGLVELEHRVDEVWRDLLAAPLEPQGISR